MHQDGTGNFKEICLMIWNEVMLGITSATHDPMICGKKGLKSCSLKGIILWGLLNFSFTCLGCVLVPWGKRSTDNTTAVNLFYIMLSLNIHLWACGVVASYVPQLSYCKNLHIVETWNGVLLMALGVEALELRIAGKAVWFEPIEDDDEEEELVGNTDSSFFHPYFCYFLVVCLKS